jgi:hypothetical protein
MWAFYFDSRSEAALIMGRQGRQRMIVKRSTTARERWPAASVAVSLAS